MKMKKQSSFCRQQLSVVVTLYVSFFHTIFPPPSIQQLLLRINCCKIYSTDADKALQLKHNDSSIFDRCYELNEREFINKMTNQTFKKALNFYCKPK